MEIKFSLCILPSEITFHTFFQQRQLFLDYRFIHHTYRPAFPAVIQAVSRIHKTSESHSLSADRQSNIPDFTQNVCAAFRMHSVSRISQRTGGSQPCRNPPVLSVPFFGLQSFYHIQKAPHHSYNRILCCPDAFHYRKDEVLYLSKQRRRGKKQFDRKSIIDAVSAIYVSEKSCRSVPAQKPPSQTQTSYRSRSSLRTCG